MKAQPGDHIILAAPTVDAPLREGEVVEVRGEDGSPPYLVRWSDGHEGLLYPGPGSVLRMDTASGEPRAAGSEPDPRQGAEGAAPRVEDWQVRVSVLGSDDDSEATVVLVADSGRHLRASGHSHRSGSDRAVPGIGHEVAVARALRRLADQLLDEAAVEIEEATGEHDVHLRAR